MTEAENLYHHISTHTPDGTAGKMFGCLCLKAPNGKAAMFFKNQKMAFKLPEPFMSEIMSLDGAKTFYPVENKPMNGWVELPVTYSEKWSGLAKEAVNYVKTLK